MPLQVFVEQVTQWDTIPSDKGGELAGYALGKYGADILALGALAKVASKSVKSAKELAALEETDQFMVARHLIF